MQWLKRMLRRAAPATEAPPWGGGDVPWLARRPSIHDFLRSALAANGGSRLPDEALTLPDEELVHQRSQSELRWAPGALDGVLSHHCQDDEGAASADQVLRALRAAAISPASAEAIKDLYDLAQTDDWANLLDRLLPAVAKNRAFQPVRLRRLARWLASESPDRGPVKLGMGLLGLLQPQHDTELLLTLGAHDEFTLYACVALGNTLPLQEAEAALWTLARRVHGWGRIHAVERLAHTQRADIQAWLLREGFRNEIMNEYLAHACAVGGGLRAALDDDAIDDELLSGAGEIIQALICGGPAADMSDYDDGPAVVARFVHHVGRQDPVALPHCVAIADIRAYVTDTERDWGELAELGWSAPHRQALVEACDRILSHPAWRTLAMEALKTDDASAFWIAAHAAEALGIDTWDVRFERQRNRRGDEWFELMRTADPARAARVAALACEQLDLARIASGPAEALGMGPEYQAHQHLDAILQELGRFPGLGWPLVTAGLRSPVIRNRHMAVSVLEQWGQEQWPGTCRSLLQQALQNEPEEEVKARIAALLGA